MQEEIPRPWDNRIALTVDFDQIGGGGGLAMIRRPVLVARCTCGGYRESFPVDTDPVGIVAHARPHMDFHPLRPVSMAQLANGDVALVMAVPGTGEEKTVHMTITVTEEIWEDSKRLAEHLGPIGSPIHFSASAERQAREEREAHENGHHLRSFPLIPIAPGEIQGLLDRLRAQAGDAGVAFFQTNWNSEPYTPTAAEGGESHE